MSTFNPAGGSAKNNGGAVLANANLSGQLDGVKGGNLVTGDVKTKEGENVFTVTGGSAYTITDIAEASGYIAFDPSAGPMAAGKSFWLTSPHDNLNGTYFVIGTSGNYFITSDPWYTCYNDYTGPYGNYQMINGTLGEDPGDPVMQGANNEHLCGEGLDFTVNQFNQYDSYVFTDCWECFSGTMDPCDISGGVVTLWRDDRLLQRVTYNKGGCVKSSNEDPGTQGDQT